MEGVAFQPWSSLPPLPSLLTKTLVSTRYPSNHHSHTTTTGETWEQSLTWVCLSALLTRVIPTHRADRLLTRPGPGNLPGRACWGGRTPQALSAPGSTRV